MRCKQRCWCGEGQPRKEQRQDEDRLQRTQVDSSQWPERGVCVLFVTVVEVGTGHVRLFGLLAQGTWDSGSQCNSPPDIAPDDP